MLVDPFETQSPDQPVPHGVFDETNALPQHIGRFRIEKILGQGGFGVVYLGLDEQLQRRVAIKVPKPQFVQRAEDRELYLKEARTVAGLEHPNIVPVHEVGSTPEFPIYIVSKYILGNDLAGHLKSKSPTNHEAVQWMIDIADALREAHRKGIVHRDIKPQNILVDQDERVYLVDFGLALADQDVGKRLPAGGTPAYMSPEQARGEGHRVDGRSDLFSLGVLFYEMLCGRRPFQGSSLLELLEQITELDPKPLRQWVESVPQELERICFKMLAKRKSERYSNAKELVDDLKVFMTKAPPDSPSAESVRTPNTTPTSANFTKAGNSDATPIAATPGSRTLKIVPKGLRSFDHRDADFFLELLPGARDRDGIPESVGFWKSRIEERDADKTFAVGLVYGPSGCGKSSMMKAGLLPRLAPDVVVIYLEATPDETERTLLTLIRKTLDSREAESTKSLADLLHEVRRGRILPREKKLVIVIDQFEQWLFSHPNAVGEPLLESLLQCDGVRVQAIVMVRDDFWMAATRFFRDLEIRLVEGSNSAAVDLFNLAHAERVLKAFGRAFGTLESDGKEDKQDRKQFITEAVKSLSEDDKVISVRLSLFAEMMKGRPWTPESLREVGGTNGVGVTFLEETFSASGAPPQHRYHQEAARSVLRALLPQAGTEIKGHKRSTDELRAACGYDNRQRDFDDLIRILDSELRLITPVDSSGETLTPSPSPRGRGEQDTRLVALAAQEQEHRESPATHPSPATQYQLTHDYLVPSLRDWLTRKQRETCKGRAELKLAERSELWNAKPENRHLPSLMEWLSIRTLTENIHWTVPQREVMKRASRVHFLRSGVAVATLLAIVSAGVFVRGQVLLRQEATRIEGLVGTLLRAEPAQISLIVKELDGNHAVAAALLSPVVALDAKTVNETRSQLHARLAMVSHDKSLVEPLLEELLTNKITYIGPIRQQLRPYAGELTEKLRTVLRDEKVDNNRRFHAATALADFVPESESASWTDADLQFVAGQLLMANSEFQPLLRENLRPISKRLLPDLEKIFGDSKSTDAQRLSAANAFADYAASDIAKLTQLLTVATPEQYAVLYALVAAAHAPATVEDLSKIAATLPPTEMGSIERIAYGQRRANSAVTLLRLGEREKVLPVFDTTDDPEALTQFIFRCRDRGVRVEELLDCLRIVGESPIDRHPRNTRYALLLAFGEYTLSEIPESRREALLMQLADTYRNDPSSGVHGAAGWLLRQWGQIEVVREVDQTPVPYTTDREWFTLAIVVKSESNSFLGLLPGSSTKKTFYYTFIVFPAGDSQIGSFGDEPDRKKDEVRHRVTLTRPFALLDREITFEELLAVYNQQYADLIQEPDCKPWDAGCICWYESVEFCRWLSHQSGLMESDQSYADSTSLDEKRYPREPASHVNWAPREWPLELGRRGFRLPTESEWEVASRAGLRTAYGYGSDATLLDRFGWFGENRAKRVHPPRQLRPGSRGLFDMHGNLFEWTHDWYDAFRESAVTDSLGAKSGSYRVHRGGSWRRDEVVCRAADRDCFDPSLRSNDIGFRVALSLSVKSPEAEKDKRAEPAGGGTE